MDVPTFGRQDGRRFDPRLSQASRIYFWFHGGFTNDKMEICKTKKTSRMEIFNDNLGLEHGNIMIIM